MRRALALTVVTTLLAGCTLAPPYQRPAPPVPQAWPVAAQPGASAADLAWKQVFLDPRLQQVIDLALANNRDLRVAVANVQKARALYHVQGSALLPTIGATASETRSHTPAAVSLTGSDLDTEQYNAAIGVSAYELDLFGRVRSLTADAFQTYLAAAEIRRAAQISLIAETASAYLALAADQDLLAVAEAALKDRDAALDLARKRFDAGAISQLDVSQFQTLAEQARSDAAAARAQVGQDDNALRLLVGADIPDNLLPAGNVDKIAILQDLPPGLPSDVLVKRPDVLSAEHTLQARNADIGAARAAFFPRISLTGAYGAASNSLKDLFSHGGPSWSFNPVISLPIFAGGAIAGLQVSKADKAAAVATYEKAVQTAFKEVADALAVRASIRERLDAQERLLAAAENASRLTQARYDQGIDSYINLLDAQRTLYGAQQSVIATRRLEAANRVELFRALGGGG